MDAREIIIQAGGADLRVRVPLPFKPLRKVLSALKTVDGAFKAGTLSDEALAVMEEVLTAVLQPLNPVVTADWVAESLSVPDFVELLNQISELSGLEKKAPAARAAESPTGPPSTES